MVLVVLLISSLLLVSPFNVPRSWLSNRLLRKTSAIPNVYLHDEVCLGNLPSSCDSLQLSELLKKNGVNDFSALAVTSYGTSDGKRVGSIKFAAEELARSAVGALKVVGFSDVSLMPNTTCIYARVDGDEIHQESAKKMFCDLKNNENVESVRINGGEYFGAYISCKSPQHVMRVVSLLPHKSNTGYRIRWKLVKEGRQPRLYCSNLHPSITVEKFVAFLDSTLGPNQYESAHIASTMRGVL